MRRAAVLASLCLLWSSGCGDPPDECADGETAECGCPGGVGPGVRTCAGGSLGACVCPGEDGGTPDAGGPPVACTGDAQCDDGAFCNGPEACVAGQCAAGAAPCGSGCDEAADACACVDADGDGAAASECGGPDCDDGDAARHPGAAEACDGVDQDCDAMIDEGAEASCSIPHASASCEAGACALASCDSPFEDCDGELANGCEVATSSSVMHCGGCGVACSAPTPACAAGVCSPETDIALGATHSCARRTDGTVVCWGANLMGQLGPGTTDARLVPTPVEGLGTVSFVGPGWQHTCVVNDAEGVLCFGANDEGQLGDGTREAHPDATVVSGLTARMVQGGLNHTCALLTDTSVACWGGNEFGQLGNGTIGIEERSLVPVPVTGLGGIIALGVGAHHNCALRSDGRLFCWGLNNHGQIGDGTIEPRPEPIEVTGVANVTDVAIGGLHSCASNSAGTASCWGLNDSGQLGDGTTIERHAPTPVSLPGVTAVAAGTLHSCGLAGGQGYCWGFNAGGALGDGTTTSRSSPTAIAGGLTDLVGIATRTLHTCATRATGHVVCWSRNIEGQCGDGTTTSPRLSPTMVVGLP